MNDKPHLVYLFFLFLAWSAVSCLTPDQPGSRTKSAADVGKGPLFETEKMARSGGNGLSAPFKGVILYSNGDFVGVEYRFPSPGRYAFDIVGASNNGTPAGVTVFVGEMPGTTAFFTQKEGEKKRAYCDVKQAGEQTFQLKLTSDIGQNDTYLDSVLVSRQSDLMKAPVPPVKGAFETGKYRNLFLERGYPEAEIQERLKSTYDQLFHGDPDNEAVMFSAGGNHLGPLAYVFDVGNGDVRSEAMSYGMMIALQMDRKEDFDALWNWARTYMYHDNPKHPCYGFFSWQMTVEGKAMDEMPAPDGEEYFIMALLFASHRWGDGEGIYNYSEQALDILDKFKNREAITGEKKSKEGMSKTTGVALMNPEAKMVRFSPDTGNFEVNGDHTDPSYHLPAFYDLWALWGPEKDRDFWREAATISRDYFHKVTHPKTGLTPDYATFDGKPLSASFNKGSDNFRWDAWRTAMNWAMDHHWWAKDKKQQDLSNRLQAFFEDQGLVTYRGLYTVDGKAAGGSDGKWHSAGLVAMNGVASLAATQERAWLFVDAVWGIPVPTGTWRYYDGMLLMLSLLHISGNFKIYMPGDAENADAVKPPAETSTGEDAK